MVTALFDTNILIDYLRGQAKARDELARYTEPAISVITRMEVLIGAAPETEAPTRRFLARFRLIGLDEAIAERAVLIRRSSRIRLPDAIILASAEANSLLLVTRNTKDFDPDSPSVRVPYRL